MRKVCMKTDNSQYRYLYIRRLAYRFCINDGIYTWKISNTSLFYRRKVSMETDTCYCIWANKSKAGIHKTGVYDRFSMDTDQCLLISTSLSYVYLTEIFVFICGNADYHLIKQTYVIQYTNHGHVINWHISGRNIWGILS